MTNRVVESGIEKLSGINDWVKEQLKGKRVCIRHPHKQGGFKCHYVFIEINSKTGRLREFSSYESELLSTGLMPGVRAYQENDNGILKTFIPFTLFCYDGEVRESKRACSQLRLRAGDLRFLSPEARENVMESVTMYNSEQRKSYSRQNQIKTPVNINDSTLAMLLTLKEQK